MSVYLYVCVLHISQIATVAMQVSHYEGTVKFMYKITSAIISKGGKVFK